MAVTVAEKTGSRISWTGEQESAELAYLVRGTADDAAALDALLAAAPATFRGLARQAAGVEPVHVDAGDGAACIWDGTVRYGRFQGSPPPETGDSTFSFDTGGGTQHITQSLATVARYAAPGQTAPDFQGAIGVTHDAVEGVDITVPVYNFSETHYLADSVVTPACKAALFALTGTVNNAAFKGFAAGEVLFLGASGSKRGEEDWEITFRFAASPNRTNFSVGLITVASKKGWDYLWVRYADAEDDAAKCLVKKPVAAYVEKVYPDGNFAGLGI